MTCSGYYTENIIVYVLIIVEQIFIQKWVSGQMINYCMRL